MSGHSARGRSGQLRSAARRKLQVVRRKVVGVSAGSIAEIVDARAAATERETRKLAAGSTGELRQTREMIETLAVSQGQRQQDLASTQALERLLFEQQLASDPPPSLSAAADRGGAQ